MNAAPRLPLLDGLTTFAHARERTATAMMHADDRTHHARTPIDGPAGKLAVHDWGGDGPPTLLAHPTGFHGRIWAPVAERLVAAGRHVWSFDFRGHGDSDAPDPDGRRVHLGRLRGRRARGRRTTSDSPAIPRSSRAATRRARPRCSSARRARPGTFARIWAYEPIMFPDDRAGTVGRRLPAQLASRGSGATSGAPSTRRTTRTRRSVRST